MGTPIGCLPLHGQQNIFLGMPLILLPEEVTLLLAKGELSSEEGPYDKRSDELRERERFRESGRAREDNAGHVFNFCLIISLSWPSKVLCG